MSTIIGYIISYVVAYLLALAIVLLIAYIEIRKLDKHISNKMSIFRENGAAQVDEIHESIDEIHQSIDKIDKSFDKMDERLDTTIEFKRLMRDYSDYKIKRIEARENFCESQFWDEKNIH